MSDIIGYRLVPITNEPLDAGMVTTTCIMDCAISGRMISSHGGGGGTVLSTQVVEKLFSPEGREFFGDCAEDFNTGGAAVL